MIKLKLVKPDNSNLGFKEIQLLKQRIYYTSEFIDSNGKKCVAYYYEWVCIADNEVMIIQEEDLIPETISGIYMTSEEYYSESINMEV